MLRHSIQLFGIILVLTHLAYGQPLPKTERIVQFENKNVKVWETIIAPSTRQPLPMHRHDYDRVLVALTGGVLKITNHKGDTHELVLKKDSAYYLAANAPGEWHRDDNMSSEAIKVMVIELKREKTT